MDSNTNKVSPEEAATNPATTILAGCGTLLLYYTIRFFVVDSKLKYSKLLLIIFSIVFAILIIVQQYTTYTILTKRICGGSQHPEELKIALVTNGMYVLMIVVLLKIFPGFKQPFANTIGFLVASIFGIKKALNNLLLSESEGDDIVKKVYDDPSLLLNLITTHNFSSVIDKLKKGNPPIIDPEQGDVNKLYKLVALKDMIGEMVWIMMAGALAVSSAYNMIYNIKECKNNPDEKDEKMKDLENTEFNEGIPGENKENE